MLNIVRTVRPYMVLWMILFLAACNSESDMILIFTKIDENEGFMHDSREKGTEVLSQLAGELGLAAEHSEDAMVFNEQDLKGFKAVVFLNTSREVLNESQQSAFEDFIHNGGGFMGVHGASTTEYDWKWYGELVGAVFSDHPEIQTATLNVVDPEHPATEFLPKEWSWTDEWYNFKQISDDLNVILTVDESTYEGGKHAEFHPISWYREFDGGRTFYTALGHSIESYDEPLFRSHLKGGLEYVVSR